MKKIILPALSLAFLLLLAGCGNPQSTPGTDARNNANESAAMPGSEGGLPPAGEMPLDGGAPPEKDTPPDSSAGGPTVN